MQLPPFLYLYESWKSGRKKALKFWAVSVDEFFEKCLYWKQILNFYIMLIVEIWRKMMIWTLEYGFAGNSTKTYPMAIVISSHSATATVQC